MNRRLSPLAGFLSLILGVHALAMAQVPKNPDGIRETAQSILSQPEFRLFPRLDPGAAASGVSEVQSGQGGSRFKSSRDMPDEPGAGDAKGEGNGPGPNGDAAPQRGPNGEPLNGAEGNAGDGNNPQNAQDALGGRQEFPEADKLENPLNDPNFNPNPNAEELNNGQQPQNPQAENQRNPNGNNAAPQVHPNGLPPDEDRLPQGNENPNRVDRIKGRNQRADNQALPAPKPRERRGSGGGSSLSLSAPPVGALAQIVGAVFHILAWAILAIICGMIGWLIVKAIRERERPFAFARGSDSAPLLDLEPAQAPGDFPADVYVTQALRLAEEGRYREAVVQLVLGAMSRVERAGWVRFRRGMTVRDYLRSLYEHPAAHQGFHAIVRVFEPVTFGRREPTRAHFDQSLKGYELGFGLD